MATKRDVAERAGVSSSTVSRVLNDNGYVSEDVRKRVLQAIQELHYVPNRIARSLKTQESRQIACITHSITNPFYGEIVLGIEEAAYLQGYTFSLYNANFEERDYKRILQEGMHDGLIVLSPVELNKVVQLEVLRETMPTVVYWDWGGKSPIPCVTVDLRFAMKQVVTYLIENGHEQIVFLGFDFDNPNENPRYLGYQDAMNEHGLPIRDEYLQLVPRWRDTMTTGYNKITEFLSTGKACTAIAASNDLLAVGAIRAAGNVGLSVPEDISITGFDDIEMAQMLVPPLTTVRIPKQVVGHALVNLLLNQIHGEVSPTAVEHPTELVRRDSVQSIKEKFANLR